MNPRRKFEDKLRKTKKDLDEAKERVHTLETSMKTWEEALKLLPKDGEDATKKLRPQSQLAKTRNAIKRKGSPMHIVEILEAINKTNNKKNRLSLAGSLGWYVRQGEIFNRPEPNTFGLIELESASEDTSKGDGEQDLDDPGLPAPVKPILVGGES